MGSWKNIAYLLRAKTKEGGLSVKPTEGLPFLLSEGLEVVFVPPILRFARQAKVARVEQTSPGKHLVFFEGIDTRDDAEKLEGHWCLVRTEDLPEEELLTGSEIQGFSVVDERLGCLGVVKDIQENPAQPLLVVSRTEKEADLLIPMVDEFIVSVDEDARCITVAIPEGLLDL